MIPKVQLRTSLAESQAEILRQRLSSLPFKIDYQEEQRGVALMVVIGCTTAQETVMRGILYELGASMADSAEA